MCWMSVAFETLVLREESSHGIMDTLMDLPFGKDWIEQLPLWIGLTVSCNQGSSLRVWFFRSQADCHLAQWNTFASTKTMAV